MTTSRSRCRHRRRGTAVVAALALVMLAAALLTSAAIAVSASSHAVLAERAALEAEAGVSTALAEALASWDAASDSLGIGQARAIVLAPGNASERTGLLFETRLSVQRLGAGIFALTADVSVGGAHVLARRRVRLLVQRDAPASPGAPSPPPMPITRWSRADLY